MDISTFAPAAKMIQEQTGIPASIILGQIMLESSGNYNGLSGLAVQGKNLFGVKGTGPAGSVYMPTKEFQNGQYVTVNAAFRKYNTYYESMLDHAKLLQKERYAKHLSKAKSVEDYAKGIKAGGYATDPDYVSKLLGIIKSNNLHQYDGDNFSFNPSANVGYGSNLPKEGSSSPSNTSKDVSGTDGFIQGTIRVIILFFVGIVGVIFFFKAFPVTDKVMDVASPLSKINKVTKMTKGGKSIGSSTAS